MLGDERLNVTCQGVLTAQRANCVLGCIQRGVASRAREVKLPLYSILVCCIQPWGAQHSKGTEQSRAMKIFREMECLSYVVAGKAERIEVAQPGTEIRYEV